jgi:hypothetical protein
VPHKTFGATRVGTAREPITFDFGLYGEERFTIVPTPSLGDTLDLYDTPEPTPENEFETVRVLVRFIRRMIDPDDVPRFNEALKRIPSDQGHIIIDLATWITEEVAAGFPIEPAPTSSSGQRVNGGGSRRKPASRSRSKK